MGSAFPAGDSSIYINLIGFLIALVVCALFSFLETSITALRLFHLKEMAEAASSYQNILKSLEENQNRVLTTIIVANSLADVVAATMGSRLSEQLFRALPESIGVPIGILFTTAAILVFGEVLPKNIAKVFGSRLFGSTLWLTNLTYYTLYPVVSLFLRLSDFILYKVTGKRNHEGEEVITSEKEIQFLIDYINKKGLLDQEKTNMLKSVFRLGTTPVEDIMVPSTAVISINSETSLENALTIFNKYQFSRFPVYEGTTDNVIGMLHLKDFFDSFLKKKTVTIKDLLRPILFVPETVKVNHLLKEFKEQHMHIAMVLNEHGAIVGMVTLEDVLEEIVGEIRDEYESITEKIIKLKEGAWLVDASIELKELERHLHITFETEEYLTLGGFLTEQLHHVPRKGERLTYKNYQFQVQQANVKRVLQVLIFSEKTQLISDYIAK